MRQVQPLNFQNGNNLDMPHNGIHMYWPNFFAKSLPLSLVMAVPAALAFSLSDISDKEAAGGLKAALEQGSAAAVSRLGVEICHATCSGRPVLYDRRGGKGDSPRPDRYWQQDHRQSFRQHELRHPDHRHHAAIPRTFSDQCHPVTSCGSNDASKSAFGYLTMR